MCSLKDLCNALGKKIIAADGQSESGTLHDYATCHSFMHVLWLTQVCELKISSYGISKSTI